MQRVTQGLSPKAILAAVVPTLGGLVAVGIQWIATGAFDRAELATAISTVIAAVLAFLGAWAGDPGNVVAVEAGQTKRAARRDSRGRYTSIAPLALLAAAHPGIGILFVLLVIGFLLGAAYLAWRREFVGAVFCVVIAILIAVFLA